MIAELISDVLKKIGHTWIMKNQAGNVWDGPTFVTPDEDDVQRVLDRAAEALYSEPIGAQLSTGGLIIEKTAEGFDAYVYCGNFTGE